MNRDLFLSILAMDSYNRGYNARLNDLKIVPGQTQLGLATILDDKGNLAARNASFYAVAYSWNGEIVISYRGTDSLSDVIYGWTTGAGWGNQAQSDLALQFYKAATGLDPFALAIPSNVVLTGHSLGGGLAGFVSALSGAPTSSGSAIVKRHSVAANDNQPPVLQGRAA